VEDSWYVFSEALAYFINKNSDWLRATVVVTPGLTGNIEVMQEKPDEYIAVDCTAVWTAFTQPGEFSQERGVYDKVRFIANATSQTELWVTLDPDIKTIADFVGKKVDVAREGSTNLRTHLRILQEYGILDKVTLLYSGYGGGKDYLKDGLADISMLLFDHIYPAGFSKGAFITDLETKGPAYYIGMDRDILLKLAKEGYGVLPVRVPPGALGGNQQPEALWANCDVTFFAADERMDEDIVYEVTRIICETAGQWDTWHPQGRHMVMPFIAAIPAIFDESMVHPGTAKYYEENDIKIKLLADLLG